MHLAVFLILYVLLKISFTNPNNAIFSSGINYCLLQNSMLHFTLIILLLYIVTRKF